jgi:hypothetical protein
MEDGLEHRAEIAELIHLFFHQLQLFECYLQESAIDLVEFLRGAKCVTQLLLRRSAVGSAENGNTLAIARRPIVARMQYPGG